MDEQTQQFGKRVAGAVARLQTRGITAGEAVDLVSTDTALHALGGPEADTGAVVREILEARGKGGADPEAGRGAMESMEERFLEQSRKRRASRPNPLLAPQYPLPGAER